MFENNFKQNVLGVVSFSHKNYDLTPGRADLICYLLRTEFMYCVGCACVRSLNWVWNSYHVVANFILKKCCCFRVFIQKRNFCCFFFQSNADSFKSFLVWCVSWTRFNLYLSLYASRITDIFPIQRNHPRKTPINLRRKDKKLYVTPICMFTKCANLINLLWYKKFTFLRCKRRHHTKM